MSDEKKKGMMTMNTKQKIEKILETFHEQAYAKYPSIVDIEIGFRDIEALCKQLEKIIEGVDDDE